MAKTDFGDDTQGAHVAAGGKKAIAIGGGQLKRFTVRGDQAQGVHLPGQALQTQPGAVGAGGNGAGQGLQVDVRFVGEAVALFVGHGAGHGQPGTAAVAECVAVSAAQSGHGFQGNQGIVGGHDAAERVAATEGAQGAGAVANGVAHHAFIGGVHQLPGGGALVTGPVLPGGSVTCVGE